MRGGGLIDGALLKAKRCQALSAGGFGEAGYPWGKQRAGREVGFELRNFYREVADGGFGSGLRSGSVYQ